MTSYEFSSLWFQVVSNLQSSMANYFAGVFGMLGVAYFVSHRLDRLASWLLVVLYTAFCLGMLSEMYELGSTLHRMAVHLNSNVDAEFVDGMLWHPAASGRTFKHIPVTTVIMTGLIYGATLLFYFRARKFRAVGFVRDVEVGA